jgi:type VI secretion system protein VasD
MKARNRTAGRWTSLGLGMVLAATAGCASSPIALHLIGEPMQNRRNSVVVHVYQLSGRLNFDRADTATFWKDDAAALGAELLEKKDVMMLPDDQQTRAINLVPKAQYIGVVADFMRPEVEGWKRIVPIDAVKRNRITIRIKEGQLSIE